MYNNATCNRLMNLADTYSYALSLLNIDMLCRQLGCAYYDYKHHGVMLFFINPKIGRLSNIFGLTLTMHYRASMILIYRHNTYSFSKDRYDYVSEFSTQQDYADYLKQCQEYTMICYKLDGIL